MWDATQSARGRGGGSGGSTAPGSSSISNTTLASWFFGSSVSAADAAAAQARLAFGAELRALEASAHSVPRDVLSSPVLPLYFHHDPARRK